MTVALGMAALAALALTPPLAYLTDKYARNKVFTIMFFSFLAAFVALIAGLVTSNA